MTALLAERSGLASVTAHPFAAVPPGIAVQGQLWWTLPKLLRDDDVSLLGGWDWTRMFQVGLATCARVTPEAWARSAAAGYSGLHDGSLALMMAGRAVMDGGAGGVGVGATASTLRSGAAGGITFVVWIWFCAGGGGTSTGGGGT